MARKQVFLSYAKEDSRRVRRLYNMLIKGGLDVWFDEKSLKPGDSWKEVAVKAIHSSDYFIAVLSSRSVNKRGFVQREIREALDILDTYPPGDVYLIPVRLDRCSPSHKRLKGLNWVNLYRGWKDEVKKIINVCLHEPVSAVKKSRSRLHTDGVYQSPTEHYAYRYYYLRFLSDKTVLAVSSDWSPANIAPYFTKQNPYVSVGKYSLRGLELCFSTRRSSGIIEYNGLVGEKSLMLKKHSKINGHRDIHEFKFKKVKALTPDNDKSET